MTETTLRDKDLGDVLFRRSARAKHYSIKIKHKKVTVVIPAMGNLSVAKQFLGNNMQRVMEIQGKQTEKKVVDRAEALQKDYELLAQARAYLPDRLKKLAAKHGFNYNRLTLRNSKTRWGSCSSKQNINLSIYLMSVPEYLRDYVMLHELCHTIHLNHSPAFWELLDKCTGNQAKTLRKEMRHFVPS